MGKADDPAPEERPSREERLAAQLRANLKRRKAQSREMEGRARAPHHASEADDSAAAPLPKDESTG